MTENVFAFALNVFSESVFNHRNLGEGDRVGEHSLCYLCPDWIKDKADK